MLLSLPLVRLNEAYCIQNRILQLTFIRASNVVYFFNLHQNCLRKGRPQTVTVLY